MTNKIEIHPFDWSVRLSKHVDLVIVLIFWMVSVFNLVANFMVYSIYPAYDLYYPGVNAVEKVVEYSIILIPLSSFFSIVLLIDRYLALKNSKKTRKDDNKASSLDFNFKKRNLIRFIIGGVISFFSLPWILAVVGIYVSDVPFLSLVFLGRQLSPYSNGLPSVHLGTHHGWDAYLFAILSLVASTSLDSKYYFENRALRSIMTGAITFLLSYAFFAGFEDGLNEQLLNRGIDTPIYWFFEKVYYSPFLFLGLTIASISFALFWYLKIEKNE